MSISVEDLEDPSRFRKILEVPYTGMLNFVLDYLKKRTTFITIFWVLCAAALCSAIWIRIGIAGDHPWLIILFHSMLGMIILPLVIIPVHELLHIIPFFLTGAKDIRIGMDLKQYFFYVTAHRYVAGPVQFFIVALTPFIVISAASAILAFVLPGTWKWSMSLFLFVHATMSAGDFAILNLYYLNRGKKIFTWDDAEKKIAYFYEEIPRDPGCDKEGDYNDRAEQQGNQPADI